MRKNGLDPNKLSVESIEPAARIAMLVTDKIPAIDFFNISRPALETDSSHELVEAVAEASGCSVREGIPFWIDGALLAVGLAAWMRPRQARLGAILVAASFAWFLAGWGSPGAGSALVFTAGLAEVDFPPLWGTARA